MTKDHAGGRRWKVGELARATGLTVRALHHFDEIGLLRPAERSPAGHRWYTGDDVRRLYRIVALRHLGLPLAGIAASLDGDTGQLEQAVRRQLDQVASQVELQHQLRRRLEAIVRALERTGEPSIDELIEAMEAIMQASTFTPDQLERLKERHREAGDEGFARWQRRLAELASEFEGHIERATDPAEEAAQATARGWDELMTHMTGGDRVILSAMYAGLDAKGPEAATRGIVSAEVWEYAKRAFAVGFGRSGQARHPQPPEA